MSSSVRIALVFCVCITVSVAYEDYVAFTDYNSFPGFGSGSSGGLFNLFSLGGAGGSGGRDPRTNTGPVLFPPSPPEDPVAASGVIPGGSGYGFVAPGTHQLLQQPGYRWEGWLNSLNWGSDSDTDLENIDYLH